MSHPSVSFRISRSAEDLAGTLHLLSQRLVQLEQRLAALEAIGLQAEQPDPALDHSLDNAERLLLDCRSLLEGALEAPPEDSAAAAAGEGRSGPADREAGSGATVQSVGRSAADQPGGSAALDRQGVRAAAVEADPQGDRAEDLLAELGAELDAERDTALEADRDGTGYRTNPSLLKGPNGRAAA
jgi:hypothetical protein